MTDTITKAAQALIAAIKIDRHDWEDWPNDSRKAFETLKAALAAPQPQFVQCRYGDGGYACCEGRGCEADEHNDAIAKAQPEPQPKGLFADMIAEHGLEFGEDMPEPQPVKQGQTLIWNQGWEACMKEWADHMKRMNDAIQKGQI